MKILTVILFATFSFNAFGQDKNGMRKIEAIRIGLITQRLELTPEQAEKFWPVYREYNDETKKIREEFRIALRQAEVDQMSEEESKALLQKRNELKEKQLSVDRKYDDKFAKVITSKQILELRRAEDDFRRMLLERLDNRRGPGMNKRPNFRDN